MVEATGRVQTLRLDDIFLGEAFGLCQSAGLAVDPARLVAYVVGAETPVAEVDLRRGVVIARSPGRRRDVDLIVPR
jgi:hypothetical protein